LEVSHITSHYLYKFKITVNMSLLKVFGLIAILEGISYLLFGITMPLKYKYEILEPNKYVGMTHGILFSVYCLVGLACAIHYKWKFGFSVMVFLASLVPFGTFYLEAKYLKKMKH
jgi:integral membrane protein